MPKDPAHYVSIAAELRQAIERGTLEPGARIPTEQELQHQYGVSRNTARGSVRLLVNEGLVEIVRGRGGGTRVRDRTRLTYWASRAEQPGIRGESDAFFSEVIAAGLAPLQTIEVGVKTLPPVVADLLAVDLADRAVLRRCVRSINGTKNSIQDSWYPRWLVDEVPELERRSDIKQGTTRLLAERGWLQVAFRDDNTARMPSHDEATVLELNAGTPVFEHRRTGYTDQRRPVRVSVNIFAGDRAVVGYTLGDMNALPESLR